VCALSIGAISGDYISGDLNYPKPPHFSTFCIAFHIFLVSGDKKGKVFPYLLPSLRPRADPSVQSVSPQVTWVEIETSNLVDIGWR